MPPFLVMRRLPGFGPVSRALLLAGAAGVLGLVSGRLAISHYGTAVLELLIVVPLLIVIAPRPLFGYIALLALTSSVFGYGILPRIAATQGHLPINIADALLIVLVGGTLWRRPWRTWPPAVRRYLALLVALLALAGFSSAQVAFLGHDQARTAVLGLKNLMYLTLALTIALELSAKMWWRFVNCALAIAAVVSFISILAAASSTVGHLTSQLNAQAVLHVSFGGSLSGTSRIRLPGLFFAYAMVIPTLVMVLMVRDRWRALRTIGLFLMLAAIGVSLNRNMYFGGIIGLFVAMLVGGPRFRYRAVLAGAVAVAAIVLVVTSVKPAVTSQIEQRAASALSTHVLSSNSAQGRAHEYHFAFQSISLHPWTGVGWMQNYGLETGDGAVVYVEDIYLHMTTDYGIPAALVFLLIPGLLLFLGVRQAKSTTDPLDRAFLGATIAAVVALLLSCVVGTYLQAPDTMASFAVACGLLLAACLRAARSGPDGPPLLTPAAQSER